MSLFRQFPDLCFILEGVANVAEKPEDSLQVGWSVIASEGECEAGERGRSRGDSAEIPAESRPHRQVLPCDTQEAWGWGERP